MDLELDSTARYANQSTKLDGTVGNQTFQSSSSYDASQDNENTGIMSENGNKDPEFGQIPTDEYERIMKEPIEIEVVSRGPSPIQGNRIVELGYLLQRTLELQNKHFQICTLGVLYVKEEQKCNKGFISRVIFNCTQCDRVYEVFTEDPKNAVSKINTGFVWVTLASGGIYSHSEELLACMDIPAMSEKMFYDTEVLLGDEWKNFLWKSMKWAGVQERDHAVENQQLSKDGTPWITVHVDGSWRKISFRTNYNSRGGMVGIIGKYTGQLLFIAVRNKYCSMCARIENAGTKGLEHKCFKNWEGSALAMEADMVVEGFNLSQEMHGVRYSKFIADGDSSVFRNSGGKYEKHEGSERTAMRKS